MEVGNILHSIQYTKDKGILPIITTKGSENDRHPRPPLVCNRMQNPYGDLENRVLDLLKSCGINTPGCRAITRVIRTYKRREAGTDVMSDANTL